MDDLLVFSPSDQTLGQQSFTAVVTATTDEAAQAQAKAQAQQQAYALYGANTQFTSFDKVYVKIDTAPDGNGFLYTATYTTTAVNVPVNTVTPVTQTEQQNLNTTTDTGVADDGTTDGIVSVIQQTNNTEESSTTRIQSNSLVATSTTTASTAQNTVDNPLHVYDSYTYCLSLHLLGIEEFNNLVDNSNPNKTYVPQNVLISSAGRWDDLLFRRNPSFTEDFYFDDFKMMSIINTTQRNRNTNLIECNFTIIEPLGFTFINRLLEAAQSVNRGQGNYLQMPYLLQIDFFGHQDGNLAPAPIRSLTKHIPIRLITLKSKVTTRGTEYQIQAVPFNHQAYSQINVTSPAAFSVTGSTVQGIFGSGQVDTLYKENLTIQKGLQREQRALQEFLSQRTTEGSEQDYINAQTALSSVTSKLNTDFSQFNVNGFCNALNTWLDDLRVQNTIRVPNFINVVFHEEIASHTLYPTGSGPVNVAQAEASGTTDRNKKTELQTAGGKDKGSLNFNGTTLTIPAGTSIDKLIDWAVRNSTYIGNQISDPTLLKDVQAGKDTFGQALKWYKIVPKIKILSYDVTQNKYALDITYYVKPYWLAAKHPYAPKGRQAGYVKKYDYIYTGKNKDVIDLQIDFDMMYLVQLTAYRASQKNNETGPGVGAGPYVNPNLTPLVPTIVNDPNSTDPSNPAPVTTGVVAGSTATLGRTGGDPQKAVVAGDLHRSIMLNARGDMINVKLRILGDPHFIKQDDIFYGQDLQPPPGQFTKNESLWMDGGELYVFLNFESPADYDETTGLADPKASRYRYSEFSGVYKIITIESSFAKGKFEQSLNLVKLLYDQGGNPLGSVANQRAESLAVSNLGPLVGNEFARFVGPRINVAQLNPGVNTQAALAVAAGTATGSGLVGSIVNQGIQAVTNQVVGKISGAVSQGVSSAIGSVTTKIQSIKYDVFGPSQSDLNQADQADAYYNGSGTTSPDVTAYPGEAPLDSLETSEFGSGFDLGGFEDLQIEDAGFIDYGDFI